MNLRIRGIAKDAAEAALDVMAAGRFLAGAEIVGGQVWIVEGEHELTAIAPPAADAWAAGSAVVRVSDATARDAARATADAIGIVAFTERPSAPGAPLRPDGDRLAARFELGLWADETVDVVLGRAAVHGLGQRLVTFDAAIAADPRPRRLVLAGLPDHGPDLEPALIAAIVHPAVLVEWAPSDPAVLALLRVAADDVEGEPAT